MPQPAARRRGGGFALIIVLWTLVLIAFVTTQLVATGRTEIRIAGNLVDHAVASAAADGGIAAAIFALLAPDPQRRWRLDGATHQVMIGDCVVALQVSDEAGRINPNLAAPALLAALLQGVGVPPQNAARLAAAIGAWAGASGAARTEAALIAEYRAAGRDYAPPGQPFETLGEMRRVLGMTAGVFAAIAPHLSLFAPAQPDPVVADPLVRAAIATVNRGSPDQRGGPAATDPTVARIRAAARGPGNARAERVAIVRVSPRTASYRVLSWHDDTAP